MIGTAGLGLEVLKGIQRSDMGKALIAGISIVILAIVLDRITQSVGVNRRGSRTAASGSNAVTTGSKAKKDTSRGVIGGETSGNN
jgi:hypothetical protein